MKRQKQQRNRQTQNCKTNQLNIKFIIITAQKIIKENKQQRTNTKQISNKCQNFKYKMTKQSNQFSIIKYL